MAYTFNTVPVESICLAVAVAAVLLPVRNAFVPELDTQGLPWQRQLQPIFGEVACVDQIRDD